MPKYMRQLPNGSKPKVKEVVLSRVIEVDTYTRAVIFFIVGVTIGLFIGMI